MKWLSITSMLRLQSFLKYQNKKTTDKAPESLSLVTLIFEYLIIRGGGGGGEGTTLAALQFMFNSHKLLL